MYSEGDVHVLELLWSNLEIITVIGCNYIESNLFNQYNQSNRRCTCRELYSGIARARFVKVLLKSSASIEGFFLGIFNDIVILYDEKKEE